MKLLEMSKNLLVVLFFFHAIGVYSAEDQNIINAQVAGNAVSPQQCCPCPKPEARIVPVLEIKPESPALPVIDDGISIQEAGVFAPGCFYGKDESQSDHAPVLYGEMGTWNTTFPISHYLFKPNPQKPASFYYNHKFATDDKGNLINRQGANVGFLGGSEVVMLKKIYTPERVKQLIYTQEGSQLKRDTAPIMEKIARAKKSFLNLIGSREEDDAAKVEKMAQLNDLESQAIKEINDANEQKFEATIDLLKISRER